MSTIQKIKHKSLVTAFKINFSFHCIDNNGFFLCEQLREIKLAFLADLTQYYSTCFHLISFVKMTFKPIDQFKLNFSEKWSLMLKVLTNLLMLLILPLSSVTTVGFSWQWEARDVYDPGKDICQSLFLNQHFFIFLVFYCIVRCKSQIKFSPQLWASIFQWFSSQYKVDCCFPSRVIL